MSSRRFSWLVGLCGAVCLLVGTVGVSTATADPSDYAFETTSATVSSAAAGGHPDFTTVIKFTQEPDPPNAPFGRTRDLSIELPRGLVGNPTNVKQCNAEEFPPDFSNALASCPQDSQVGVTHIELAGESNVLNTPVYALKPPAQGDVVARLGFIAVFFPVYIDLHVRAASDYGLTATITTPPSQLPLIKAETTLWGVPGSSSHDSERFSYAESIFCGGSCGGGKASGLSPAPFLSNPTNCGPQSVGFAADSYLEPERVIHATVPLTDIVECERVGFEPSLRVVPTNSTAGEPTGLEVDLVLPQNESAKGVASSALRAATVTLPQGMAINPSAADGLAACSAAEVGYGTDGASDCPQAAKIGSATLISPSLSKPLSGAIYQRTPEPGDLFRLWLVTDEQGVHLKLPGEVRADPDTGQLTASFAETPELPAEEIKLDFKGGARAPLRNPLSCGTYGTHYRLTPWSGNAPTDGVSQMTIDRGCAGAGFDPGLTAGVSDPVAGLYSAFATDVTREDGEENVARIDLGLPEGELAKLAGVPLCEGAAAATGACPAASRVGSVQAAVGTGTMPLQIPEPGKSPTAVYLSGPYKGAPYSLVVVVPAQAGPFDLGTVVTMAGIYVDPETARVTVKSDPLPQILEGVPVEYRRIHVAIDRPNFSLNPTSCEVMSVESTVASAGGQVATPRSRFQIGDCNALAFKPKLRLSLKGSTKRRGHPSLEAAVTYPERGEYANIARAQVNLPRGEFLDQGNLNRTCRRPVLLAGGCPESSVYGHARAWTPLLEKPLEGNVYLVGGYGYKLPALVADLNGQIRVLLVGKVDSGKNRGIRNTFEVVPDAPVSRFELQMKGGKKYGLLENSENLCKARKSKRRAIVRFTGHNGKVRQWKPVVRNQCGKKRKHKKQPSHSRQVAQKTTAHSRTP